MRFLGVMALLAALLVSASMAVLLTEAGQLLNVPLAWPLAALAYRVPVVIACLLMLVLGSVLLWREAGVGAARLALVNAVVVGLLLAAFFIMPYFFFPTKQYDARYLSVAEVGGLLQDEQDVVVLELGDQAHALPTSMLWQPHVAGVQAGGEDVAVTYCVLTNSAVAFSPVIDDTRADFKVLMQAHNNLLLFDENSGEVIQQFERRTTSGESLSTYPTQMMSWGAFRVLYPDGKVFYNPYDGLREKFVDVVFGIPLRKYVEPGNNDALFPTLRLDDDRLPNKEKIWGVVYAGEALAVTRDYLFHAPIVNVVVGGRAVVLAWFPEYDTVGAFIRPDSADVTEIDVHGNTPDGKLPRADLFSEVYWMVWSHFHPQASLLM